MCNGLKVNKYVLSGGFTMKKSYPYHSEAEAMLHFVKYKICLNNIFVDEISVSSYENIFHSREIFLNEGIITADSCTKYEIHIFCEKSRAWKVRAFAKTIFGKHLIVNIHSFDFGSSHFGTFLQKYIVSPCELLISKVPFLNEMFHRFKRFRARYR